MRLINYNIYLFKEDKYGIFNTKFSLLINLII